MIPLKFFKTFLASLGCCLVFFSCYSQISQPGRFEKELKQNENNFTIISLKDEGLALVRALNQYSHGNRTWEVMLLDSSLQEIKNIQIDLDTQSKFIGYEYEPGFVHILFHKNELKGEFEIVSIKLDTYDQLTYTFTCELTLVPTHFTKVAKYFILAGQVNLDPTILLFSVTTKSLKILPGFFKKGTEIIDLRTNKNQTFNITMIDWADNLMKKIIVQTFDSNGNQLLEDQSTIENEKVLRTGITSELSREDLVLMGTWSKRNAKSSHGFYTFPVNPFLDQSIALVYFGQLNHYLDYLKPKKASKIKRKTLSAIERGNTPDFTNNIILNKIVEFQEGFILGFESYSTPSSTSPSGYNSNYLTYNPYHYYPPNSFPISNAPSVAATEVKHVQSAAMAVDETGKVLWDFSCKLSNVNGAVIESLTDFLFSGDSIHFLYKDLSMVKRKSISIVNGGANESSSKIILTGPHDEIRSEAKLEGSIKQWYDHNFYVWGYQTIRNRTRVYNSTHEVFYINKIVIK